MFFEHNRSTANEDKMTSPAKSLSVRDDGDGSFCIHKKVKPEVYKSVADYWFDIEMFVIFEQDMRSFIGYILDVHKLVGDKDVSR